MTARRLPTLVATLLVAAVVVGLAAPVADAGRPRTRHHPVRTRITLDTNLLSRSGTSAWAIDEYLRSHTSLPPLGAAFMAAERKHGVNARFLLAAAMHESAWGRSSLSRFKHNLFGYNAYDRDPGRYASAFRGYASGIDGVARFIKEAYLTPGGRWWSGQPTLRAMQRYWSSSGQWGEGVSRIARSIRLASLRGRSIRFAAPVVRGGLNPDERATIQLQWSGGAIPAGIRFRATWVPVILDAQVIDASAAAGKPVSVTARRTSTKARAITLAATAPRTPGRYRLQVTMLDVKGTALPRADRISIPRAEVRIWGKRAVGVTIEPDGAGTGATVRITNTGRWGIPAVPGWTASAPNPDEVREVRTTVTVTATPIEPSKTAPVLLLSVPLREDLAPGASVTFDVPEIAAATGRSVNWLAVDLRVEGDPAWLSAYLPVGILRTGTRLGAPSQPGMGRLAGLAVTGAQATGYAAPHVEPSATPAPTVAAARPSPSVAPVAKPAATPAPRATPSPKAAPAPTPKPKVAPKPAPSRKPVTRTISERSGAIRYRGGWDSAPYGAYMGGRVAWSANPGATARFTFTGRSVTWIGPLGSTRGRAVVLIDGRAVTSVSLWRSSFVPRAVVFRRTFRATGRHTLTIRVLSSPGHQTVAIDGFIVRS